VPVLSVHDVGEDRARTCEPELLGERSGAEDVGLRAHERRR
jgi:hypothetical protein